MFDRETTLTPTTILTLDGSFDYAAPTCKDVRLGDVVNSLSRIQRFGGHLPNGTSYSVAEHSVLVLRLLQWAHPEARRQLQLAALFHDAAEAYLGDVPTPMKRAMGEAWRSFEHKIEAVVGRRFQCARLLRNPAIREADRLAYQVERRDLFGWADIRFDREPPLMRDMLVLAADPDREFLRNVRCLAGGLFPLLAQEAGFCLAQR